MTIKLKNMINKINLIAFSVLISINAMASDISVVNEQGQEIWYIPDDENNTARVSFKGLYSPSYEEYFGDVVIPETIEYNGNTYVVNSIGSRVFQGCNTVTSITIPKTVTDIFIDTDNESIYCVKSLKSIIVDPENPNFCSKDGVLYNKSMTMLIKYPSSKEDTEFVIPESVTELNSRAFYECSNLKSITLPTNLKEIGGYSFFDCDGLTDFVIPEGVAELPEGAFFQCANLVSVKMPNSVTKIGAGAFSECHNLSDAVIPSNVTEIGDRAFYACEKITSLTIPQGVKSIDDYAFWGCVGLKSVTIPEGVECISQAVFYGCDNLTSITIPSTVKEIEWGAFYECKKLENVSCNATIPPTIDAKAFYRVNSDICFNVPDSSVEAYKEALKSTDVKDAKIDGTITSISSNVSNDVSIRVVGNKLIVSGVIKYEVYDYYGKNLGKVESLGRGMYVVLAEGKSYKIVVR